jgi:hypothetical protein
MTRSWTYGNEAADGRISEPVCGELLICVENQ